jgi:hypothetical protein
VLDVLSADLEDNQEGDVVLCLCAFSNCKPARELMKSMPGRFLHHSPMVSIDIPCFDIDYLHLNTK